MLRIDYSSPTPSASGYLALDNDNCMTALGDIAHRKMFAIQNTLCKYPPERRDEIIRKIFEGMINFTIFG